MSIAIKKNCIWHYSGIVLPIPKIVRVFSDHKINIMDLQIIADTILTGTQAFITNTGGEIAKSFGKDCYERIKSFFKEGKEKEMIDRLETQPLTPDMLFEFRMLVMENLSAQPVFYKEISGRISVTPANSFILEQVLGSMSKIKKELENLYEWWIKAKGENKGDIQVQIEQLELQLTQLEIKVFSIIGKNNRAGAAPG